MIRGVRYKKFFIPVGWFILSLVFVSCTNEESLKDEDAPFERLLVDQKLESVILNRSLDYAVLLPEGYDDSEESYPVVYLLHGYGEDETAWYTSGNIQAYVDAYIAETVPMIYVMPQGFNRYYIDKYNGSFPYMQMFVDELVPAIDAIFRTKADKTQRAVMGYSMGGYGALILPAMNPDVFTISIPLSMSFRTDEQYVAESQGSFDNQWAPNFGPNAGASGTARLTDYFKERSPFYFFDQEELSAYQDLKILIDCGDDEESLSFTNDDLHTLMREREMAHEYRVRSGGHSFDYWRKSYREALIFISNAVQNIEHPSEPTPVTIGTPIVSSDYELLDVSGVSLNILKPVDYSTTTVDYPVLYLIHDYEEGNRTENAINVFSLLRNNMTSGKIPQSIVVEIPDSESISIDLMEEIIAQVDMDLRTLEEKGRRVLMGNAIGGTHAATLISENADLFGSCFLMCAKLPDETMNAQSDIFYYLDITDDCTGYSGYNSLYTQIRNYEIEYEYRVRQGGESYQSFLNGLGECFSSLKESLNN
jgi:enterochelin esterase-like enzyme